MDLFYDVSLLRRIAPQCVEVLCSTGFSLCGFDFRLALRKAPRSLCHSTALDLRPGC